MTYKIPCSWSKVHSWSKVKAQALQTAAHGAVEHKWEGGCQGKGWKRPRLTVCKLVSREKRAELNAQ